MFPGLAIRLKNITADMGSGIVVIAGCMLAITMMFLLVLANGITLNNRTESYMDADKPVIESSLEETGTITVVVP